MENIYTFLGVVLSAIIFSIAFNALNESRLKLFVPLQNMARKSNHKKVLRVTTFLIAILICIIIKETLNLSFIVFAITVGFFSSLTEVIFSTSVASKRNYNT